MLTASKRALKLSLVTVITLFFLAFSVVNRDIVHVSVFPLPYSIEMPEFLFAIFCFTLGLIVGWVVVSLKLSKSQRLLKSEHKRVMALQNEVGLQSVISASRGDLEPNTPTEQISLDPRARRG